MNGTTDKCKPVYPHISKRGNKISLFKIWKEIQTNTEKNPLIQFIIIDPLTIYDYSRLHSLQRSLTKTFITQNMKRKKLGQIQRRISIRRLVRNFTIQFIIINLHTKYDNSSLHSFREIFDEIFHHSKYGKKEDRTYKQEKAIPRCNISFSTCIPNMITLATMVSQKSLKINFIIQSMERKKI